MRRIFAALGVFAVVALTGAQPAVAAPTAPPVPVLSLPQDKVSLRLEGDDTSAVTHFLVSNADAAGAVTVQFIDDSTGRPLTLRHGQDPAGTPYRVSLAAHRVTAMNLTVTVGGSAVDGHIIVQAIGGAAAVTTFATARTPATSWLWFPIGGTFLAFLVVLFAWHWPRSVQAMRGDVLGVAADWKFADSWASNITALAAVTGSVLGLSGFLDDVLHDVVVTRFIGLDALFLALVAGAPLLFSAFAKRRGDDRLGTVGGFLLASWLTLTAAFGELAVLGLMLYMARGGAGTWLVAALLAAAAIVLVVYAWRSIGDTITHKRSHARRGSRTKSLTRSQARANPRAARVPLL
jgi:hypothetical protein